MISASIDTNAVGVRAGKLELRFNEVVAERPAVSGGSPSLDAIVLVSPRTGLPKVDWNRESISIEPRGGFKPNTTYRITLLPGLADLRGNVSKSTRTYVFSTGAQIQPFGILGRVFDWQAGTIAPDAVVEAVANAGAPDSSIYIAIADTLGQFELGPLGPGQYLVRTFIDADRNRDRGVLEKWDTATVTVSDHRPSIELLAAQRDTAPIGIERIEALDSLWVRVDLDKPFDPRTQLVPLMIRLRRADSSVVQVDTVVNEERAAAMRARPDSGAAPPPVTPPQPAAGAAPATRPPEARPSRPRPTDVIMIRVRPTTPLRAGERYTITVFGIPNLTARSGAAVGVFDGPRPPRPPS